MAGMSRLQTDAAIITPAANPRKMRCMSAEDCFFVKNTIAAPITVIENVNPVPAAAQRSACVINNLPSELDYANSKNTTKFLPLSSVLDKNI